MKQILHFLRKLIQKDPPKQLGRWNIDYCFKKIDRKIDSSNEDHCGPCGQTRFLPRKNDSPNTK